MTTATPATRPAPASAAEVQETVRAALADRTPLRVVGRGTWLTAGRPVRATRELSLAAVGGVVAYTPGDLTITALAGTSLGAIDAVTRAEGQFLALDPAGGDAGSLGATVATGSAGPLAHAFGPPRDNVLGVEFVTGTGALVRGGGRVVKNVAGFDLTRLVTGAWGTLGVVTEVTVRLRALPEAGATLAVAAPPPAELGPWLARARALAPAAYALELVDGTLAATLGLRGDATVLLARLGGNEPTVRTQVAALRSLGDAAEVAPAVWESLRTAEPPGAAVARLSALPGHLAATWAAAAAMVRAADPAAGFVHAAVGRGVARCILPTAAPDALEDAVRGSSFAGTRIFERLPAPLWARLAPSAVSEPLSRRTRDAFDPHRILNPGILGEDATV